MTCFSNPSYLRRNEPLREAAPLAMPLQIAATFVAALVLLCAAPRTSSAQNQLQGPEPTGMELIEIDPFDIVRFTEESGGGAVRTLPFDFPNREVPTNASGLLIMDLVGLDGEQYQAAWKDIKEVELWEKRLMRETKERIAKKDFDGAYPFFMILLRDYPHLPELDSMRADYLYRNAGTAFGQNKFKQTLAILESLREFNPSYNEATVLRVIGEVTDKLMEDLVDQGKLDYAQKLHARLEKEYQGTGLTSIEKWADRFLAMAMEKREKALAARAAGDMREARQMARESYAIWPRIEGGQELVAKIDREYPLINVGVLQTATEFDPTRIDNWPARRAGRILYRSLFEITGAGPEGGEYDFLFGELETSDDRKSLYFDIKSGVLPPPLGDANSFDIGEMILNRAIPMDADYTTSWAAVLDRVEIPTSRNVVAHLHRPHVVPQAMLQRKIDGSAFGGKPDSPTGDYRFDVQEDGVTRFVYSKEQPDATQPREIVEIELKDSSDAVNGLLRGTLDVVDQLFPADAAVLRRQESVRVVNYPLPSIHMLVPCSDHDFIVDRTFRRALLYGINRQTILEGELLANKPVQGCRVLSGPFPAGIEQDDPLAYAYDDSIAARTYQPRLASLLVTMTTAQLSAMAERREEEPPKMTPIRIGYPQSDLANVACEAIKTQLGFLEGVDIELVKLPLGQTWPEEGTCDLVYVMASIWEPVVDARRILGPEGLAQSDSQLIGMGLCRLENSKSWRDVREGLRELHRIAHHELPVLPLWQLVDAYAYRKAIAGVGNENVALYQKIDSWRLIP